MKKFKSIIDLLREFPDEVSCQKYLASLRWESKPVCPKCENKKIYVFSDGKRYKCSSCKLIFNPKAGRIFEDTRIPLQTWFLAIYLMTSHKKGISSMQLAKDLNITQKSAWFMLHRLRYALSTKSFNRPLEGVIQLDETYIGGKNKNRHAHKKVPNSQGRSLKDKTAVFGLMQSDGRVKTFKVLDVQAKTLEPIIINNVATDAILMSDEWRAYTKLHMMYQHYVVRHDQGIYAMKHEDGFDVHINSLEGFWSLVKRSIIGIYHFVSPKHLDKYLSEWEFRYNNRQLNEQNKVDLMLIFSNGYLSYKELISNVEEKKAG